MSYMAEPEVITLIGELSEARKQTSYSTILSRECYNSPDVFELERQKVFAKQWLLCGHESELKQVGDYTTQVFAGESIVIVRTSENEISGFLNVCRHRGHELCPNPKGNIRKFTCPYHHWTYGLDGNLRNVPSRPDGESFDYKDWGLWKVHVTVFHGFIFYCTGENRPPALESKFESIENDLSQLESRNLKIAVREKYKIKTNWKILLENYLECYHCGGGHATLCVTVDLPAMHSRTDEWQDPYFSGRIPLKAGMKTLSLDGNIVAPPLGVFKDATELPDSFGTGFGVLPILSRVIYHVDHVVTHTMRPIAVDDVEWETTWYVRGDAVEGVDYDPDIVKKPWDVTNKEDKSFCESTFRGIKSQRFTPG
ncbi:MAG: aromatic ring-hydroxylating oxygenase subunit alpha, partial [Pyrinomonadaceae bacterium]